MPPAPRKKATTRTRKTTAAAVAAPAGRFPSGEQLRVLEDEWGLRPAVDPEALALRLDRHLATVPAPPAAVRVAGADGAPTVPVAEVRRWLVQLTSSLSRVRVDHRRLDQAAKDRFNKALKDAHADHSYQPFAAIHADMGHMMHSMMGPIGTRRFLPWHRLYTLRCEDLLRRKQPGLTIPYWDFATDHHRPDWVWQPPGVQRGVPGAAGDHLPTQAVIDGLQHRRTYTGFTSHLETDAHNNVHNWCNGTISDPMTATQDPIFWLLHANVDRVWDHWQLTHSGRPSLAGTDAVLDPWQPTTAAQVDDITPLGYSYG
ncbi:tyrosinase family protein [Kitasatospora sp. NPDC048365]|uniref:tyrosinase family protein n=1 Tax=Kitasatospora sp. NPDC048365 TaxID=3364050 RepID=UPI0037140D2E